LQQHRLTEEGVGKTLAKKLRTSWPIQLRAPRAVVREVKQQGPILTPQRSIYFCFKNGDGENSMSK